MALNRTQAVLTAYLNRVQDVENAIFTLLSALSIAGALTAGASDLLNKLGSIVGEKRFGRPDADYAIGIRLAIRTNISNGRAVDIIAIMLIILPSTQFQYLEGYPAMFTVDAISLPSAQYIAQKLHHARAAGTYGLLTYTESGWTPFYLDCATSAIAGAGVLDSVSGGVSTPAKLSAALAL